MDVGDSGIEVSQSAEIPQADTSLDDLPEFNEVSFDDEDDGLQMYDEEPVEENNIFKDLDLDTETDDVVSSVNMDVFDEGNMEELTIDEDTETEDASETSEDMEPAEEIKAAAEIKIEGTEEQQKPEDSEGMTEMLSVGQGEDTHEFDITEIAHTADGVTEIAAESKEGRKSQS